MAKNVIIMVGDGMGWEMARAAAIQKQLDAGATGNTLSEFYTEGTGSGLSFQELDGYAIATTGGTYIDGDKENSALKGDTLTRETGVAVIREGYQPDELPFYDENGNFIGAEVVGFNLDENGNFIGVDAEGNPLVDENGNPIIEVGSDAPILGIFDAGFDESPVFAETAEGELVQVGGIFNAYDTSQGRDLPWEEDEQKDYPKNLYPDSANTATTLYSAVKSYNAAIGVDIYEEDLDTLGEVARESGKSFGVVTSVPFSHATPAAAIGHVSHRNKNTATESVENFEIVLDENGVPLHEDHSNDHEGEPVFELDEDGNLIPIEDDNILYQILNETQPEVVIGGGHPDGRGDERYMDLGTLEQLRNGETVYTFTERGENAAITLEQIAAGLDVNQGDKLFGLYGARGQGGNLPWLTADGDYSNTGLSSRLDAVRPLEEGETDADFVASEIDANPTLAQMTTAALDVLGDDEEGFWLMVEGGDIDWAMHDNNIDNAIGATLSFDEAFEAVDGWIQSNGGYEENLLIVTADHDHYLTLNENFPELLRDLGAEALTTAVDENGDPIITTDAEGNPVKEDNTDPVASGHYWGSDPDLKYGWAHHTTIPVPVYYQGDGAEYLDQSVGQGFESYGFEVPGIDGLIDQVHIAEAMFEAVSEEDALPTATLVGFSSLPADTFRPGLPGGSGNAISSDNRETPFEEQPVQGFSGVQFADDGNYWFLSDNGYGAKDNSADYLLRVFKVDPNFQTPDGGTGDADVLDFIQLSDPNELIDFEIVQEDTPERLLTGADFDIESLVVAEDGTLWIGDEFGPYLLHFDANGVLIDAPIPTPNVVEFDTLNGQTPLVIAHRGASGLRPEHTLEAYELAIEQGADFIEPDLVATKDGVLIARHENALATVELDENGEIVFDENGDPIVTSETTNVATFEKFRDRLTVKSIDGELFGGWFSEDFTLSEIKELRARERIPGTRPDNTAFDDQFEIPTLAEVIQLVKEVEAETGKQIGIYPETKHPTFFQEEGTLIDGTPIDINLGATLVATLVAEGFTDPDRIFIQSFEVENLIELQNQILPFFSNFFGSEIVDIPLVQLFGDVEDAFINEMGGGFSVPYDIVYNFSQDDFDAADALETYGDLVNLVPDFGEDVTGDDIPDTTYQDLATAEVFDYIGQAYAEGIGPWKNSFLLRESLDEPVDGNGDGVAQITSQLTGEVRPYVDWAHDAGMQIHPYTLRNEEQFLTLNPDGTPQTPEQEFEQLIDLGVDGFFTDFPGTGAMVVDQLTAEEVRSPDNPAVLAGEAVANLSRSRGFEGMGYSPDGLTLYPMLEGAVTGDPDNAVRIYEFDVTSETYSDEIVGFYGLDDPSHAIGDMTPINETEFIVIERDGNQGEAAAFKKLFKVDLSEVDENGFVEKTELVDLLNIADPNDLNNDGSLSFEFPFVTIEDVLVLDEDTLLVANDNNYPFSIGRGPDIDNNEIIQIELDEPLDLDSRLGQPDEETRTPEVSTNVFGTSGMDMYDTEVPGDSGFIGDNQRLFAGSGNDFVDVTFAPGGNRIDLGSGDDMVFAGTDNRILAGSGDDMLFLGSGGGNNTVTGGSGSDQFWIVTDGVDLPEMANLITDFMSGVDAIGLGSTSLSFADLTLTVDGNDTIINGLGQDLAIVRQVTNLSESDFVFA